MSMEKNLGKREKKERSDNNNLKVEMIKAH
jgi:hypothetical protein